MFTARHMLSLRVREKRNRSDVYLLLLIAMEPSFHSVRKAPFTSRLLGLIKRNQIYSEGKKVYHMFLGLANSKPNC